VTTAGTIITETLIDWSMGAWCPSPPLPPEVSPLPRNSSSIRLYTTKVCGFSTIPLARLPSSCALIPPPSLSHHAHCTS